MRYGFGFLLGTVLLAASAQAAGPFDGSWTGEVSSATMGRGAVCPAAVIKATVTDGKMSGHFSDGQYTYTFTGTVAPDGTLTNGKLGGTNPVTGKFTQNEFTATYVSTGCEGKSRQMTMHRG